MTRILFDSVDPAMFPDPGKVPFDATAGYVNGRWPSSAGILKRFPNLPHVSITVNSTGNAMCLDVEPGDATPADVPAWLDRQYARGLTKPVIYCGNGDIAEVRRLCGPRPFWWWSANWTRVAHIDPGADATQWDDKGPNGEGVDQSQISDAFYASLPGAPMALTADDIAAIFDYKVELINPKDGKPFDPPRTISLREALKWSDYNFGKASAVTPASPAGPTVAQIATAVADENARRQQS